MSKNYHAISESRGHKGPKLLRIIMAVLIVAVLFAASLSLLPNTTSEIPSIPIHAGISYTAHANISIIGNSQFNNTNFPSNGVVSGNGTISNPYVIEGWDIGTWIADGIYVEGTTVHFIIRNCYSHATSIPTGHAAIFLNDCTNATIRDNNCSYQDYGIHLYQSSGVTIINNTCWHSIGIYLETSSNHNVIENNNCSNGYNGICLYYSSNNNTVRENECNLNTGLYGICLNESDYNTVSDNSCNDNRGISSIVCAISVNMSANNTLINNSCQNGDIGIQLSSHSTHNAVINNSCESNLYENLELDYSSGFNSLIRNRCTQSNRGITIFSQSNIVANNSCSNNGDGIYLGLGYSRFNALIDNNCSKNYNGIRLVSSAHNNLNGNNCSNNQNGILLYSASNDNSLIGNLVSNNSLDNNTNYGVMIQDGSKNRIWNNSLINNNGANDTYNASHVQAYDDDASNWWNSSGYGNYWFDWRVPDSVAPFGIVDKPYNISGSAGAKDYFPLTILGADFYPPTTTVSLSGTSGADGWNRSSVTVSLKAIDSDSGVNATFYRIGTSGSWLKYSYPLVFSSDGNYTVQFYSRDSSGNNETVRNIIFKIDRTAPTLTINQTAGLEATVDHVLISWNGSDATSGIDHFEVSIDGGAFVSVGTNMSHNFSGLADGTHNITIRAIDVAGNEVDRTIQVTVQTIASGAGTSGDLMLYGAIVTITVIILATIFIMMRKKKAPPMKLDEMKAEPPAIP